MAIGTTTNDQRWPNARRASVSRLHNRLLSLYSMVLQPSYRDAVALINSMPIQFLDNTAATKIITHAVSLARFKLAASSIYSENRIIVVEPLMRSIIFNY